jgi:DNA polymerase-1
VSASVAPSLRTIYEADKRAAELCTRMQVTGFAFDTERAADLRSCLVNAEAKAVAAAREASGVDELNPFSVKQLQDAFFKRLRAPIFFRSNLTGQPSLGVDAMRGYAACADERLRTLALAVLEARRARKVRATYVDAIVLGPDGRVHPSWLNYGAVSGRWACQAPNLMNLPRPENDPTHAAGLGGVRSVYIARPGYRIVAFDKAQLEMRVAAYVSGDPVMIRACESADLHAANAEAIFGAAFNAHEYAELAAASDLGPDRKARLKLLKALRTLAKTSGFAVCYLAEAGTVFARLVAAGADVTLRRVEAMLSKMRRAFAAYYGWQAARLLDCVRTGYVYSPILRRRRWLGHDPSPTEAANFPIQAGAADLMNTQLPIICDRLADAALDASLVAQVHDSAVFEVRESHVDRVKGICREVSEAPVTIATSGAELTAVFPIDIDDSDRWH